MRIHEWKFSLNETVVIKCSKEQGLVIAKMQSIDTTDQYQIRYNTSVGTAVEAWWAESALRPMPTEKN